MTDDRHQHSGSESEYAPDRDLNVKGIVIVGLALVVATFLGALISWYVSVGLRSRLEGQDPPPPVLLEAQRSYEPPGPRLQVDPVGELTALRAEEDEILNNYAWTDASEATAQVPIERAMELLLESKLGGEAFGAAVPPEAAPEEAPIEAEAEPEPEEATDEG